MNDGSKGHIFHISMKNYFGAEEFLLSIGVNKEQANIVLKATDAFGTVEFLEEAKKLFVDKKYEVNFIHRDIYEYHVKEKYDFVILNSY